MDICKYTFLPGCKWHYNQNCQIESHDSLGKIKKIPSHNNVSRCVGLKLLKADWSKLKKKNQTNKQKQKIRKSKN